MDILEKKRLLDDITNIQTPVTEQILETPAIGFNIHKLSWTHEFEGEKYNIDVYHDQAKDWYYAYIKKGFTQIERINATFCMRNIPSLKASAKKLFETAKMTLHKQNTKQKTVEATLIEVRDMLQDLMTIEGRDKLMRARITVSLAMVNAMITTHKAGKTMRDNIKNAYSRTKSR